jgi:hypothetical protein
MTRLSTHLPQLASLALAVIAAAVSHAVHVDGSASSRAGEARNQTAAPTAASGKPRLRPASTGRKAGPRGADRGARGAESFGKGSRPSRLRRPQEPLDRPLAVTVAAPAPSVPRPRHGDRLRAEPGVHRGVDGDFQQPLVGLPTPGLPAPPPPIPTAPVPTAPVPTAPVPTAPVPTAPVPTPPGSGATSGGPTDMDAAAGASDEGTGAATAPTTAAPGAANPDDARPVAPGDPGALMPPSGDDAAAPPAAVTPALVGTLG